MKSTTESRSRAERPAPLSKARSSRLVWFRVSPEEFDCISQFCEASGRRTVSEVCRSALWWFMRVDEDRARGPLAEEVHALRTDVQELSDSVGRLNLLLGLPVRGGMRVS